MKSLILNVIFDKATLFKSMDAFKTDTLYVLPGSNVTDTNKTLKFFESSKIPVFGHVETELYFVKKFNLPCRFLKKEENSKVPFFISFSGSGRLGGQSILLDWEFYSPIVVEFYENAILSPIVAAPLNAGSVFNTLSITVSYSLSK